MALVQYIVSWCSLMALSVFPFVANIHVLPPVEKQVPDSGIGFWKKKNKIGIHIQQTKK